MKQLLAIIFLLFSAVAGFGVPSQDWIRTGTGLGVEKIRLAVPDFKLTTNDPGTQNFAITFNITLWNDLQAAGIFDMVSKSFYPLAPPGAPQEVISPIGASLLRMPTCWPSATSASRADT